MMIVIQEEKEIRVQETPPILCYHFIVSRGFVGDSKETIMVTVNELKDQLDTLARGYTTGEKVIIHRN